MKVILVMSSGKEIPFECDNVTARKSKFESSPESIQFSGLKGQSFLFIRLDRLDAVLYDINDQKEATDAGQG